MSEGGGRDGEILVNVAKINTILGCGANSPRFLTSARHKPVQGTISTFIDMYS